MHPMWGFGFFVLVNRVVSAEHAWLAQLREPGAIGKLVAKGVGRGRDGGCLFLFSVSHSRTRDHGVVVVYHRELPSMVNALVIVVPATIGFAWLFFRFCEKPYMRNPGQGRANEKERRIPVI